MEEKKEAGDTAPAAKPVQPKPGKPSTPPDSDN